MFTARHVSIAAASPRLPRCDPGVRQRVATACLKSPSPQLDEARYHVYEGQTLRESQR
jgi:hypothetical protein